MTNLNIPKIVHSIHKQRKDVNWMQYIMSLRLLLYNNLHFLLNGVALSLVEYKKWEMNYQNSFSFLAQIKVKKKNRREASSSSKQNAYLSLTN